MMNDDQQVVYDYIEKEGFYDGLHFILTAQANKKVDTAYINLTKLEFANVLVRLAKKEEN